MIPNSFFLDSRPCFDGSRSSIVCRRSMSDLATGASLLNNPEPIARTGLSSSRFDTSAESRISLSPIARTASLFCWNSGEWMSRSVVPDTN